MEENDQPLNGLIVLTPIKQSREHSVVRFTREYGVQGDQVIHIAGGPHTGIIINKMTDHPPQNLDKLSDYCHTVFLHDEKGVKHQERRTLNVGLADDVREDEGKHILNNLLLEVAKSSCNDYVSLMKYILKMLQHKYPEVTRIDLDLRIVDKGEESYVPESVQIAAETSFHPEQVSAVAVQEILEHAYPNGITAERITTQLNTHKDIVQQFLRDLEESGIAERVEDEWLRVDTRAQDADGARVHALAATSNQPYGDSNIYTLGRIGRHRVVATKLAFVGDTREAATSAGSITTRLLGNFQKIEHVFVVGVGGSVPHISDTQRHGRLGDVVVSNKYVFAHDLSLTHIHRQLKDFLTRSYIPDDNLICEIVKSGSSDTLLTQWEHHTSEAIGKLASRSEADFSRPPSSTDILTLYNNGNVVYLPHPNADMKQNRIHVGTVGGLREGCVREAAIKQREAVGDVHNGHTNGHNGDNGEAGEELSQEDINKMENEVRSDFSSKFMLRSMDAGFDSVVAAIVGSRVESWALIRGLADYHNGHSKTMMSKQWQAHAAVRAAALTRAIIERLPDSN